MSDNNRPEWASGPEWEGWKQMTNMLDMACMERTATGGIEITICPDSMVICSNDDDAVGLNCEPRLALAAANALAEASGGWA